MLPGHKADRFFEGNKIIIPAQRFTLHPLRHFSSYLTSRDSIHPIASPLWLTEAGKVPTRSFFVTRLRLFFERDVAGQSMRAGGATALAEQEEPYPSPGFPLRQRGILFHVSGLISSVSSLFSLLLLAFFLVFLPFVLPSPLYTGTFLYSTNLLLSSSCSPLPHHPHQKKKKKNPLFLLHNTKKKKKLIFSSTCLCNIYLLEVWPAEQPLNLPPATTSPSKVPVTIGRV